MIKVLIVDDDAIIRETLCAVLQRAGYAAHHAANGSRAIEMLDRENFDVVLTDIWMPEMEGFETIMHITKAHPRIRVVAMSGRAQTERYDVLKFAKDLGAADVLEKPFSTEELLSAVKPGAARQQPPAPLRLSLAR